MDKKYLDKFYNEMRDTKGASSISTVTIPMAIIYNSLITTCSKNIRGHNDLTKSEVDVLIALSQHGHTMSPTELYKALVFSSSGIAKVLKKLEKKELISRKESDEDKRSMLVVLEKKGLDIATESLAKIESYHEKFFINLNTNI